MTILGFTGNDKGSFTIQVNYDKSWLFFVVLALVEGGKKKEE
jgi:hypothetical protein